MFKKKAGLASLIKRLAVDWHDQDLLYQALTHSSCTYEGRQNGFDNNQRLEFLGDAVLDLAVSDFLFRSDPNCDEGNLTKMRAALV
ncbi:MAG: ribonuclease III domain-containing protein, partial [Desulfotomaculaceae bacterium]|nr:ribonuclease III domain-containing protein [Desulfotomaculaceae bacterium]